VVNVDKSGPLANTQKNLRNGEAGCGLLN